MGHERKTRIIMATEGTYPFVGGGVSTWCHQLCEGLDEIEFDILAVTGDGQVAWKYARMPAVNRVQHIPLWPGEEPGIFLQPGPFADVVEQRWRTSESSVRAEFVPALRVLLEEIFVGNVEIEMLVGAIVEMGVYLRSHDFKAAMRCRPVWREFCDVVQRYTEQHPGESHPTIADVTLCARWFYNMMMPIAATPHASDCFHATIASACALPGIVGRKVDGVSFMLTDHGVYLRERYIAISRAEFPQVQKKFLVGLAILFGRACYHVADIVSPVARFNARWERPFGCSEEKIRVVYNGVQTDKFCPGPKPERLRGKPVAVAAARVFPLKDLETMIRGTRVAVDLNPEIQTIAYGSLNADPPYVQMCRDLISELDLSDNFEFGGFHPDPYGIFIEGDISVLSSISEGFPYTVLEAMSSGVPCVATDVGGVREAVADAGIVVPPRNPEEFGRAMAELLGDTERRKELARKSRERVVTEFTLQKQLDGYRGLYEMLCERTRSHLRGAA